LPAGALPEEGRRQTTRWDFKTKINKKLLFLIFLAAVFKRYGKWLMADGG